MTRRGSAIGSAIDGWDSTMAQLEKLLKAAGLEDVQVDVGARLTGDPFTVLVASGRVGSEPIVTRWGQSHES